MTGTLARDVASDWRIWTADAACLGEPLETFFAEQGIAHVYDRAREICSDCTVLETCRTANDSAERDLPTGMLFGFFAGETPTERARRRRREVVASLSPTASDAVG